MVKKAQVTIFTIIAILIVAVAFGYVLLQGDIKPVVTPDIKPVYSYVGNCIDKTANDAVYYIGQTGGYFIVPEKSLDIHMAYYYDQGKNYTPSKKRIENELALYFDTMLFFCTKNFIDYPDFEIEQGEPLTRVEIEPGKVIFDVDYPIVISKNNRNHYYKRFHTEVPVRLYGIHEVAENITKLQMKAPYICVSCLHEIASDNKLFIKMYDYTQEDLIFEIIDNQTRINGEDFRFYFANKYEIGEWIIE
ncbi:hypothetical protein GF386_00085 [Candidatus Pacearchaeota archaeon]|nr:hypothetical protein [Candidatus Pacearchaeota archaeon]MBD3282680.1 hypothetical protein [Candidatus Pacearchaeota archaeon]